MTPLCARLERGSMPEPNSGCWLWLESVNRHGYGRFRWEGRNQLAHRLSFAAANGQIPSRMVVRHKCDNPGCINPAHLMIGTQADNCHDMRARGRSSDGRPRPSVRGEGNGHAKHSEETMLAVRDASGTYADIAKRFGVSKSSVGYVKRGIQWGHLS